VAVKRVLLLVVSVVGFGLFASGVHGLTQLDGQLAGAAKAPRTIEIKREPGPKGDCPWRERETHRYERYQRRL
jgi:hypothetical protein